MPIKFEEGIMELPEQPNMKHPDDYNTFSQYKDKNGNWINPDEDIPSSKDQRELLYVFLLILLGLIGYVLIDAFF